MPVINIRVRRRKADNPLNRIVCGNSDYQIVFNFDEEWDAYEMKTARFIYNGQHVDVVFTGNTCDVPVITNATEVTVGVFAGDLRTTTPAKIGCDKSILCGNEAPAAPTEDVYAQIMEYLNNGVKDGYSPTVEVSEVEGGHKIKITDAEDEKSVIVLDGKDGEQGPAGNRGPQGPQGPAGPAGKTPEPGIDYWTETDKQSIVNEAANAVVSQKVVTDAFEQKAQEIIESLASPIIGTVDENNNIVLNGELAEGEYTLRYLTGDKYLEIGTLIISAEDPAPDTTLNWSPGVKIDSSTGAETTGNAGYSASDYIAIVDGYTYALTKNMTRSEACKVCYYDADKNFISTSADVIAQTTNLTSATIPLIDGAAYFRLRLYGTASALADGDYTLTATKE